MQFTDAELAVIDAALSIAASVYDDLLWERQAAQARALADRIAVPRELRVSLPGVHCAFVAAHPGEVQS